MCKGAAHVVEEDANGNLFGSGAQEIGAADPYVVIVEDEDLDVDRLPCGRQFPFESAEEGGSPEVVGELPMYRVPEADLVEVRLKGGGAGVRGG